ncbi:MAG: tetratricopeptide repeat protein [Saprospiraceae bacterium]|nr:tetratricopeptide repeat protein [Saprospiraceae bacterium]
MENSERLDKYLRGAMDAEEKAGFEAQLAKDAELAKALELQRDMELFLRRNTQREALKKQLPAIGKDYFQTAQGAKVITMPRQRRLFLAAASLAAAIALFFMVRWALSPSLFESYAQYPPLALTEKSAGADWSQAETAFNSNNYAEAERLLTQYTAEYPSDRQAALYLGICNMETGKIEEAQTAFRNFTPEETDFKDFADWYLALSYLKAGDKTGCRQALQQLSPNSPFQQKATDLLQKL